MSSRFYAFFWGGILAGLLFGACSNSSDKDASGSKSANRRASVPKPEPIPLHELWHISSMSSGELAATAKTIRKEGIAPRLYLKEVLEQARVFYGLKRGLQASDSTERHAGYDFRYFLPVPELRKPGPVSVLYRRGNDSVPGLVSLVDTAGPNNLELHPFFWKERVLFFVDYFGEDSRHQKAFEVPGFFIQDLPGDHALYFQPATGVLPDTTIGAYQRVMWLGSHLLPDKELVLRKGNVVSRADFVFRDTMKYATVYSYRYGRRCDFEWLDDGMYLSDLQEHIAGNRCGGDKQKMLPQVASNRLPLWAQPVGGYLSLESPAQKEDRGSERPLQRWKLHVSGRGGSSGKAEPKTLRLGDLLKAGQGLGMGRPVGRLYRGKGLDTRKLVVNTDKPGDDLRFVRYHENGTGQLDYVAVVDSAGGQTNLEVFMAPLDGGRILFRLRFFGKDAAHESGREVAGFFVHDPLNRAAFRVVGKGEGLPGTVKELARIEMLDTEWLVSKALEVEDGKAVRQRTYRYDRLESRDRRAEGWRTQELVSEKKPCEGLVLGVDRSWDEVVELLKNPRCGEKGEEKTLSVEDQVVPLWTGKETVKKEENPAKKNDDPS